MANYNWQCPHCEKYGTITDNDVSDDWHYLTIGNKLGQHAFQSSFVVCPNPDCKKYTLKISLRAYTPATQVSRRTFSAPHFQMRLVPFGAARTLPDYVPVAIRNDYVEACSIRELSPKASATLARRAVQGVIHDFFGISRRTLKLELDDLGTHIGTQIAQDTWDGIDAVRAVGNIGAHMESDINVIVDVDPDEAQLLIGLVETLIDDTYIARAGRQERAGRLQALKESKTQARKGEP